MSKAIKLMNNSALVFLARAFEIISGILVVGITARYLGVSDFGEYSLVMAVAWISQPIISTAIPRMLTWELSRNLSKTKSYIGIGITWNLMVLGVFVTGLWLLNTIMSFMLLYYLVALFIAVLVSLTQTVGAVFIASERMKYETYTSLISMFSLVLFTAGAIYLDLGLSNILILTTAAYLCGLVAAVLFSRKLTGFIPMPNADYQALRLLLAGSFTISIIQALMQLFFYSGSFFLKNMSGSAEVAFFQSSLRVFTRFMVIPLSLTVAFLPEFTRLAADEERKEEFVRTVKNVYRFFLIVSMLITITAFTTAREVILLIYGKEFANSVDGFKILVLSTIFFYINTFFVTLSIACNRTTNFVRIKILEVVFCILLNLILVPAYGHIGSILALVVTSCIMSFGGYFFFRDILQKDSLKAMSLIIPLGFGIIIILNWMPPLNVIITLIAGTASFVFLMFMSKMAAWDELMPIFTAIRRKTPKVQVLQK